MSLGFLQSLIISHLLLQDKTHKHQENIQALNLSISINK